MWREGVFGRNVGGADRLVRGVFGSGLLTVAIGALLAERCSAGVAAAVGSAALLFNVTTGRCGMNKLLGINTCPNE